MMYWHFATMKDGVPVMRDGTPIEIGKRYILPKAKMCKRGFHGSPTPLDALQYAPGAWVSRREIVVTDKDKDKVVGTSCVHMVGADATEVLSKFARMRAPDVVHLWDAAWYAARYAAWDAAWDAARDAARAAAWAAERDAAWYAARDAAVMCERGFHGSPTAMDAWYAARDAARDAAWAAERDATWANQNKRLSRMLNKLLKETV